MDSRTRSFVFDDEVSKARKTPQREAMDVFHSIDELCRRLVFTDSIKDLPFGDVLRSIHGPMGRSLPESIRVLAGEILSIYNGFPILTHTCEGVGKKWITDLHLGSEKMQNLIRLIAVKRRR